jgi:PAS domain-containing protein
MEISLSELTAFNISKSPILFWDELEICRYANPAFFNWYGKKQNDILGKLDLKSLLGDSNYLGTHDIIAKALKGTKETFELVLNMMDSEPREVLFTLLPYTINNHVIGFFLHLTDFTELRQAAKKEPIFEQASMGIFANFVENSPVPAWIVDAGATVRYLNEAYMKVKPQVKVGYSFLKTFPKEVAEAYQKTNQEILALRKTFTGIEKVIDGILGERVFKIVKFPLIYENKFMIGGFAIDITEQVLAQPKK